MTIRFPSVGERAMKATSAATLFTLVAALVIPESADAASAAGRTFDYRGARPALDISTDESVVLAVQDRREYVVSGNKPESWVGLIRSRVGIPFDVHTTSNNALAADLAYALVQTLSFHNVRASYVRVGPDDAPDQVMSRLVKSGAQKILLITILEWRTDTYTTTRMDFQFKAELFDAAGVSLARHTTQGSEALGRINAGQTAERKLGDLLRGPISSALQGPKAASIAPAPGPGPGGSVLMQQVQCRVAGAAPASMTRLACSQQNGEVVNP